MSSFSAEPGATVPARGAPSARLTATRAVYAVVALAHGLMTLLIGADALHNPAGIASMLSEQLVWFGSIVFLAPAAAVMASALAFGSGGDALRRNLGFVLLAFVAAQLWTMAVRGQIGSGLLYVLIAVSAGGLFVIWRDRSRLATAVALARPAALPRGRTEAGQAQMTRQRVVPIFGAGGWLWNLGSLALFALAGFIIGPVLNAPRPGGEVSGVLIALIPWGGLALRGTWTSLYLKSKRGEVEGMIANAFREFGGREPLASFADLGGVQGARTVSGTGIAWNGTDLLVVDSGELGVVPWRLVRSWECVVAGRTTFYGSGSSGVQATVANQAESFTQLRASGLFITVKNIDKPVWQVMTTKKAVLDRWAEILTQIEEQQAASRAAGAPSAAE